MNRDTAEFDAYKAAFRRLPSPDTTDPAGGYLVPDEMAARIHAEAVALLDENRAISGGKGEQIAKSL